MDNTQPLREFVETRIELAGDGAKYARKIGVSGPTISEFRRAITQEVSAKLRKAICNEAGIEEEDLLAISKGRDPFAVVAVSEEAGGTYATQADKPARLAAFLRTLSEEQQNIIYATASALGFTQNASSSQSGGQKMNAGAA